ncbi:MAG: alpha-2-macroglobulin family protein [Opitutaceae bacterium]
MDSETRRVPRWSEAMLSLVPMFLLSFTRRPFHPRTGCWVPRAIWISWLLLAASVFAQDRAPTYHNLVAKARDYTTAKAHTLARDAYRAAYAVAPDEESKRWCRLWELESHLAGTRREDARAEIEALLTPYAAAHRPRDEYWARAMILQLGNVSERTYAQRVDGWLELAQFWSLEPPSKLAQESLTQAIGYLLYLLRPDESSDEADQTARQRVLTWLTWAAQNTRGELRGEMAVILAEAIEVSRTAQTDEATVERAHELAQQATAGSPLETAARVARVWWRHASADGWSPRGGDSLASATEFSEAIAEIEAVLEFAVARPPDPNPIAQIPRRLRDLRELLVKLKTPNLSLVADRVQHSDSPAVFHLRVRHASEIRVELHHLDDATFITLQIAGRNGWTLPNSLSSSKASATWNVATGIAPRDLGQVTLTRAIHDPIAPGNYVLVARASRDGIDYSAHTDLQVTSARAIALVTRPHQVELRVIEANTGRSLTVSSAVFQAKGLRYPFATQTTEAPVAVLPASATSDYRSAGIIGLAEGQPFFASIPWTDPAFNTQPVWKYHFTTDRTLYTPGETVHWKLVARKHVSGQTITPEGALVTVWVRRNWRDNLAQWPVVLNRMGSATGSFVVPPDSSPQSLRFYYRAAEDKEAQAVGETAIRIDHFRPPEIKLSIAVPIEPQNLPRPGSLLSPEFTARYFSGEPVPNATLSVSAQMYPIGWATSRDPNADRDKDPRPRQEKVTLRTDHFGRARWPWTIPSDLKHVYLMGINAEVAVAGAQASASFSLLARPLGYTAQIVPASQPSPAQPPSVYYPLDPSVLSVVAQRPYPIAVLTYGATQEPVPANVTLSVFRQVWSDVWQRPDGSVVDLARRRDLAQETPTGHRLRAGYLDTWVHSEKITISASGRGTCLLPPMEPGVYEVRLQDQNALPSDGPVAVCRVFCVDEHSLQLPLSPDETPQVFFCDPHLIPGSDLKVLIINPKAPQPVWVGLGTSSTFDSRVVPCEQNATFLVLPWRDSYRDGVAITCVPLLYPNAPTYRRRLEPPPRSDAMRVMVRSDTTTKQPGSTETLHVQTLNAEGKPVASEVLVSVTDASLASLVSPKRTKIEDSLRFTPRFFHPRVETGTNPIWNGPRTTASPAGLSPRATPVKTFKPDLEFYRQGSGGVGRGMFASDSDDGSDPRIRENFKSTAAWLPEVLTDANGEATVEFTYPDNLTTWTVGTEAIGGDHLFGTASTTTQTTLPLQSRLRIPRAIVVGDTLDAIGVFVSSHAQPLDGTAALRLEEDDAPRLMRTSPEKASFSVPAQGETHATWTLKARQPGTAHLTLEARSAPASDAMKLPLSILEDGVLQPTGTAGRVGDKPLLLTFDLPTPLDPSRTTVTFQLSPGVVPSVVGALPYLIDYPYGCIEQTLNRFLPAAVAAAWLREVGLKSSDLDRLLAPPSRSTGSGSTAPRPSLDVVIQQGLARLEAGQLGSDGFGWWPRSNKDSFMTGLVMRGLTTARQAAVALPGNLEKTTRAACLRFLSADRDPSPTVTTAWLLAAVLASQPNEISELKRLRLVFDRLYGSRDALPPVGWALLAQAAHALSRTGEAQELVVGLEKRARVQRSRDLGETATWGEGGTYVPGLQGTVESTALCLEALLQINPAHPLVDSAAASLLLNRQSNRWSNTRDTAHAALALLAYARSRKESIADASFQVSVNGRPAGTHAFTPQSTFAPHTLPIPADAVKPGRNTIKVTRLRGQSPGYVTVTTQSWAPSPTIKARGDFLKVSRDFIRAAPRPTLLGAPAYEPQVIAADSTSTRRDERVECRIRIEVGQDLDYVMIDCPKPGGCEPVNPLSGWDTTLRSVLPGDPQGGLPERFSAGRSLYREEHPDRSVFFLHHLPAGTWELRYTLRATFAGDYRALPVVAQAMYAPVISANTDARRLVIQPVSSESP